jgi:hypothetical protein
MTPIVFASLIPQVGVTKYGKNANQLQKLKLLEEKSREYI